MIIGIPKEIKDNENRVGITPAGVEMLTGAGHRVMIESHAGRGSGFTDEAYTACGAETVCSVDLVVKVKEPLAQEYRYFREGLTLFTYLHLAANTALTKALINNRVTEISYETVQLADGSLRKSIYRK